MKITIQRDQLNQSIQQVFKAATNKTIPILSGIKIEASDAGVTLTASDTDISIQSFIPSESNNQTNILIHRKGSIVLPSRFLNELVRKLPLKDVEIEVKESYSTTIKSGNSEIQMVGLDPEEFPIMPKIEENKVFSISSDLLKSIIKQTIFAISTNEATPVLTGVLWNLDNEVLKCVATDRHRLASRETYIETEAGLSFNNIVISGRTLNELSKIIPDQNAIIEIVVADNQVLFKMDGLLFYSRILDGTYPDTTKIIPQIYKTELVLNTRNFIDAMERVYLLSREEKTNIVKLITLEDQSIEITSSLSELGKITEQVAVENYIGEALKISFNSRYMLDVLKVMDSELLYIGFTGPMSPIIIKPLDDKKMLHLILPFRTTG